MAYLASLFFQNDFTVARENGLWLFLSVGAIALFVVFIPTVSWIDSRRKEREAFYKADTMRRISESSPDSAKAAIELLREQERAERLKKREGMKIGGLITLAVGIALVIFLRNQPGDPGAYLVGLIPGMIGIAMLVYVYVLAAPVE